MVDILLRFSETVLDLGDLLAEVDVNPLIVGAKGAVAADALVIARSGDVGRGST